MSYSWAVEKSREEFLPIGGCGGGSSGQHNEHFFCNRNCAKHFIYVVLLTSQLSDEGSTTSWLLAIF